MVLHEGFVCFTMDLLLTTSAFICLLVVSLYSVLFLCGTDVFRGSDADDNGGWHTEDEDRIPVSERCNVERRNAVYLSQSDFQSRYAFSEPVVIYNMRNDRFREVTHREVMMSEWAHEAVTLNSANTYSYGRVASTFGDYVSDLLKAQRPNSLGNETLYLFGDIDPDRWAPLLDEYNKPKWRLPEHEPALSFGIAGAGTGVPFHFHGPVFAEVIYGAKQWFLYPFDQRPKFDPDRSSLDWYLNDYPKLERLKRPLECLVKPGEVIYIPDKWWHATLNTETSVFMSTFLSRQTYS